ncbi:MAG TPA: dephospho-CoA kinase [Clostridiaceae bacterium]|nr:dephospho-CoA kinase [Clostridiaceae bacterium]
MKVIGVTGGIGSGKSTIAKILCDLGASIIDADKIAREITVKGQLIMEEIVGYFGTSVLDEEGELDRKKLSEIVFADSKKLEVLNCITHKYIADKIKDELNKLEEAKAKIVVLDAPLPVENGFLDVVDESWVVVANRDIRIKRIMERSKISSEEALARIKMQKSDEEYLKIADEVINNDGSVEELEKSIAKLYIQKSLGEIR